MSEKANPTRIIFSGATDYAKVLGIDFAFVTTLPVPTDALAMPAGDLNVEIDVLNADGERLSRSSVPADLLCFDGGATDSEPAFGFAGVAPLYEGARLVRFFVLGDPIGELPLAAERLEVSLHVDMQSENIASVYWTLTEPTDFTPHFLLMYTHDEGATWLPVYMSTSGEAACVIDLTTLPGGESCKMALLTFVGGATAETLSDGFSVASKGLTCSVHAPIDGAYVIGPSVFVAGQAIDAETGRVSEDLVWRSHQKEGGASEVRHGQTAIMNLNPGEHVLTLEAEEGLASDSVTINVVGESQSHWDEPRTTP